MDIKRCHALRPALQLLDFDDASIEGVQGLLLRAAMLPAFLRLAEGRRFVAYLFTLHVRGGRDKVAFMWGWGLLSLHTLLRLMLERLGGQTCGCSLCDLHARGTRCCSGSPVHAACNGVSCNGMGCQVTLLCPLLHPACSTACWLMMSWACH